MMKIEEGKSYRLRNGEVTYDSPVRRVEDGMVYWVIDGRHYTDSGTCSYLGRGDDPPHERKWRQEFDIVAEIPSVAFPVVVETVTRIVPGTHNGLEVKHFAGEAGVYITADAGLWDASKLRAGAAIMTQYADALDEGAR